LRASLAFFFSLFLFFFNEATLSRARAMSSPSCDETISKFKIFSRGREKNNLGCGNGRENPRLRTKKAKKYGVPMKTLRQKYKKTTT